MFSFIKQFAATVLCSLFINRRLLRLLRAMSRPRTHTHIYCFYSSFRLSSAYVNFHCVYQRSLLQTIYKVQKYVFFYVRTHNACWMLFALGLVLFFLCVFVVEFRSGIPATQSRPRYPVVRRNLTFPSFLFPPHRLVFGTFSNSVHLVNAVSSSGYGLNVITNNN